MQQSSMPQSSMQQSRMQQSTSINNNRQCNNRLQKEFSMIITTRLPVTTTIHLKCCYGGCWRSITPLSSLTRISWLDTIFGNTPKTIRKFNKETKGSTEPKLIEPSKNQNYPSLKFSKDVRDYFMRLSVIKWPKDGLEIML